MILQGPPLDPWRPPKHSPLWLFGAQTLRDELGVLGADHVGPEGPRGGHTVAPVGGGGGCSGGGEEWPASSMFCRKSQAYFPTRCGTGKKGVEETSGAQPELGMDGMAPARGRELRVAPVQGGRGCSVLGVLAMVWLSDISVD